MEQWMEQTSTEKFLLLPEVCLHLSVAENSGELAERTYLDLLHRLQ